MFLKQLHLFANNHGSRARSRGCLVDSLLSCWRDPSRLPVRSSDPVHLKLLRRRIERTHLCCTSLGECYVTIWVLVHALSFELSGQPTLVLCACVHLSVRNMCYLSPRAEPENTDQRQTHIYQAAIGRSPWVSRPAEFGYLLRNMWSTTKLGNVNVSSMQCLYHCPQENPRGIKK